MIGNISYLRPWHREKFQLIVRQFELSYYNIRKEMESVKNAIFMINLYCYDTFKNIIIKEQ